VRPDTPANFESDVFGGEFEPYSDDFLEITPDISVKQSGYSCDDNESWWRRYDIWVKIPENLWIDLDSIDDSELERTGYDNYSDLVAGYTDDVREELSSVVKHLYDEANEHKQLIVDDIKDFGLSYSGTHFIFVMEVGTGDDWSVR